MYTTQNNRQRGGVGGYRKIDVCNIEQQIEREIVRQRGGGGSYRQMYTTQNNRQRERQLDEKEEEKVATDRYIQHRTTDRERQLDREEEEEATDRQMYVTQNNR